jgi:hypothetical protein
MSWHTQCRDRWKAERLVGRAKRVQALRPTGHLFRPRAVNKRYKRGAQVPVILLRVRRTSRSAVEELASSRGSRVTTRPTNNPCKCNTLVVVAGRSLSKSSEHLVIDGQTAAVPSITRASLRANSSTTVGGRMRAMRVRPGSPAADRPGEID